MEPKLTANFIEKASYAELSQLCNKLDVIFQNQPKWKLQELLIAKIEPESGELYSGEIEAKLENLNDSIVNEANKTKPVKAKKAAKKITQTKPIPVKKAKKAQKASKSNNRETKSNKILALYLKGKKVTEISKALNAHPSFCYTVINKQKSK